MYTYIRTRTCTVLVLVPIYSTLPTYLVVTSFVPLYTVKVSTYLQGQEESRINVHFSSPPRVFHQLSFFFAFCCKGNSKTTYSTYLTWLFFMDAFYWFYTRY